MFFISIKAIFMTVNIKLFDPLEQLDILQLASLMSLTNLIFFLFVLVALLVWLQKATFKDKERGNMHTNHLSFRNFFFGFIENIANSNITLTKQFFLILYHFAFLIILGSNIIGLVPFSFTITSSFIITFSFPFIYFIVINIFAIYNKGFYSFFSMFFPAGSPVQIAPLLVLIELVSYIARVSSLSIRLFANMMAGHTLLKILIGFSFSMLLSLSALIPFALLP